MYLIIHTNLILWDAVNAHGGDRCEHYSDGDQAEELAGDGVARVLQRQPQTLPDVPVTHLLEILHVSARRAAVTGQHKAAGTEGREAGYVLPVQVRYLVHRRVYAADVALVVPAAMPAALQLAVMVTVTAATVQEELIDAPVLDLLTVWGRKGSKQVHLSLKMTVRQPSSSQKSDKLIKKKLN